jgi:integrase/recombinase XerC
MFKNEFVQYISAEKRFSEHTIKSYLTDLNQFTLYINYEFEIHEDVNEINFQIIRSWIASMLEKGMNPRSVNRKISTLKTYFKFLLRNEFLKENPMLKVVSPKSRKGLPVFIEEDQMESLLTQVAFEEGFIGQRNKLIIEFFYVTGIRLSELINIKIKDIDFQNQLIKVLGKRNKERLIPLSSSIVVELKQFIDEHQLKLFLFSDFNGKKLYTKLVYRLVNKYIGEISSVNKRSPHILRHTFATHMLNNGADINAIKELLGHANLSATQVYTHNTIEKLKTVYNQAHPRA